MWTCPQRVWLLTFFSVQTRRSRRVFITCRPGYASGCRRIYLETVWGAQSTAAIRNGDMDYVVARQHRKKEHGFASSLRFVGIKRVKPNPRGGNLINQLLRREAFILLNPADSVRHRVWVLSLTLDINRYVFYRWGGTSGTNHRVPSRSLLPI